MVHSGKWAIITGASSGIGKALATEFAAGGFNLLLIARNQASLAEVAAGCHDKHGVETEVAVADLACASSVESVIATVRSRPRHYEVLVNNAGFGIHGDFASGDIEQNIQL